MKHRVDFQSRLALATLLIALVATRVPSLQNASVSLAAAPAPINQPEDVWAKVVQGDAFVYQIDDGQARCRPATAEESRGIQERDADDQQLRVITAAVVKKAEGIVPQAGDINIVLRGTSQLTSFPQARDGFLRAAERWTAVLRTPVPITIIIDVDFGPTRFGTPYPANVLGSTGTQSLSSSDAYPDVRAALIAGAASAREVILYNALPRQVVPTDLGATPGMTLPSAPLRALGLINPVADPTGEATQFGAPPSIGFNSNFAFDFEPSNGIDPDKIDFDAVATHEIGHALGFSSRVGSRELSPGAALDLSILDVYRFRPGPASSAQIEPDDFTTAPRILSSGGDQVFFAEGPELPLSTGRPNGTGGDGFQAGHWKSNSFVGSTIGIMDPAIAFGERQVMTENDTRAYDTFGYLRRDGGGPAGPAPTVNSLAAKLQGDVLTLTGQAMDEQGDIAQAQTTLLDSDNNVVVQNPPVGGLVSGQTTINFNLQLNGLNSVPAATKVALILIDSQGNRSSGLIADFSQADPGGPNLKSASFSGSKLTLKGSDFVGQLQIEINGIIVANKNNDSNRKAKIKGNATNLNIRTGPNRLRVINANLSSNLLVATF